MSLSNGYAVDGLYEYVEIQFDSLNAFNTPDASYSSLNWPLFNMEQVQNIAAIKIIAADIPFTYYTFNSNNNTFLLTESDGGGATTVTIPVGNYNSTTFITAAQTALGTASANSHAYTITYSSTTGKFTFTSNAGTTKTFTLTFGTTGDPGFTNPRRMIGFNAGSATSNTSQVLVAPNFAMIQGDNYIYINTSVGNGTSNYLPLTNTGTAGGRSTPMTACIPVDVNAGAIINWQDETPEYFFAHEIDHLETLDFYLTLGNNPQKLDLNGQPFKLKVAFLTINQTSSTRQTPLYYNQRVAKKIRF